MSGEYINPDTNPWGYETSVVHGWMRKEWISAHEPVTYSADTPENRRLFNITLTQWYEDKYKQENRYANYTLTNLKVWIKQKYDESKVHTPNNVGPKPRTHY